MIDIKIDNYDRFHYEVKKGRQTITVGSFDAPARRSFTVGSEEGYDWAAKSALSDAYLGSPESVVGHAEMMELAFGGGRGWAISRKPAAKPAARKATPNGRAKYGFYVVDKLTGLVHAGNEFREDAVDERKAMIEEGVPAGRVAVMTAASVRSKFGQIRWGTGRP